VRYQKHPSVPVNFIAPDRAVDRFARADGYFHGYPAIQPADIHTYRHSHPDSNFFGYLYIYRLHHSNLYCYRHGHLYGQFSLMRTLTSSLTPPAHVLPQPRHLYAYLYTRSTLTRTLTPSITSTATHTDTPSPTLTRSLSPFLALTATHTSFASLTRKVTPILKATASRTASLTYTFTKTNSPTETACSPHFHTHFHRRAHSRLLIARPPHKPPQTSSATFTPTAIFTATVRTSTPSQTSIANPDPYVNFSKNEYSHPLCNPAQPHTHRHQYPRICRMQHGA